LTNLIIITSALILVGILLLYITKGKVSYTLVVNYGVAILPLAPYVVGLITSLFSDDAYDVRVFDYLGIEIVSFSLVLLIFGIIFFPLVISLISMGIYRSITLPKQSNY
jgi:hypothetical protein